MTCQKWVKLVKRWSNTGERGLIEAQPTADRWINRLRSIYPASDPESGAHSRPRLASTKNRAGGWLETTAPLAQNRRRIFQREPAISNFRAKQENQADFRGPTGPNKTHGWSARRDGRSSGAAWASGSRAGFVGPWLKVVPTRPRGGRVPHTRTCPAH